MASYCAVSGCKNNSRSKPHLSFFSLPKDEHRRRAWIERMRRPELLAKESRSKYYLCSEHFARDSIRNKRLKQDALPTLNMADPLEGDRSYNVEVKQEPTVYLPANAEQSAECPSPMPSSSQMQISSTRTIKRSLSSTSDHSMDHYEPPAEVSFPETGDQKPTVASTYDEYDHFGLMIASKIRKIDSFEERETVMNVIQNIVFQSVMKMRSSTNDLPAS